MKSESNHIATYKQSRQGLLPALCKAQLSPMIFDLPM